MTKHDLIAAELQAEKPLVDRVKDYLLWYGYLPLGIQSDSLSAETVIATVSGALKRLQQVAGIQATGKIDAATLDLMKQPRCGVPDYLLMNLAEAKWRKTQLSYFIESYVNGISQTDQEELIRLAWKDWDDLAAITLTRANSKATADMVISTGRGANYGFDGPSGTLAWAYLPNGSDRQLLMRFDLDENWSARQNADVFFRAVACHEFGHLLGLDHSRKSSALMAPYYNRGIWQPQQEDDIPRIHSLYGDDVPSNPIPDPDKKSIRITQDIDLLTSKQTDFKMVYL